MWISRSTFLEREELRRDPFPLSRGQNENAVSSLPGNGQSLFIRPAATRIGSGYNCRVPGKESLVETGSTYIYIYIFILFLFPNKSTRERKHTG